MKQRLDVYLCEAGLCQSRARAKELVENGQVLVNGTVAKKASQSIAAGIDTVTIEGAQNPFVSRGGLKLQKAVECFGLMLNGAVAMDIGASTGGFTQCMLECGAKKVYAVDVGTDQLHESLRGDSRVVNMEQTNIRYLEGIEPLDFISADVSFISLKSVLPKIQEFLKESGQAVVLIKPQFEAGKQSLNKKGVVKDIKVHKAVVRDIIAFSESVGLYPVGLSYSPIRGPEGNIEYLLLLSGRDAGTVLQNPDLTVAESHKVL